MIKKTIKYTDYNGVKREEDFYFNLSKAELTDMQLGEEGGYGEMIQRIAKTQDIPQIMKVFKTIILKSYGEKSADGKRFVKSKEMSEAFCQTEAYSEMFMEFVEHPDRFAEFIKGVVPADIEKYVEELEKKQA